MATVVSWNLQLNVRPNQLPAARALMSDMVQATGDEPGTLTYEWFLSEDGTVCHLYERYADSDAALVHLGNFGAKFADQFMGCFEPTAFFVYGEPRDDVKGVLDAFGAQYLGTLGGFSR